RGGNVAAITGGEQLNSKNIERLLSKSQGFNLPKAREVKDFGVIGHKNSLFYPTIRVLDNEKKVKRLDILNEDEVYFKSILTKYKEGYISMLGFDSTRISLSNVGIEHLYMIAFLDKMESAGIHQISFGYGRRIWEIKDNDLLKLRDSTCSAESRKGGEDSALSWFRRYAFCYELQVPKDWGTENKHAIMLRELNTFFGRMYKLNASWERRNVTCMALIRTNGEESVLSKGGVPILKHTPFSFDVQNIALDEFVAELAAYYFPKSPFPMIDETGYKSKIDLNISCDIRNVELVNGELAKYGLKLVKMDKELDVIVFRQLNE
ncbi:MAG: hypothetical protein SFU20_13265, partial [Chitinophagaceae bacterium]|nr:hypothetical protein [Chitinophagaceae bacterium]